MNKAEKIGKKITLYDFIYIKFSKGQNYRVGKQIHIWQGLCMMGVLGVPVKGWLSSEGIFLHLGCNHGCTNLHK